MDAPRRVIVVGGGPGGLCAAMLLAHHGFQVTVLEKESGLGGRTGRIQFDGYTFDRGSTLLMMTFVAEEMFDLVGRRLHEEIDTVALDPFNGTDVTFIRDLAGHQDIKTTARYYLGKDSKVLRAVVAKHLRYE